jgi:hypothetical protein
MSRKNRHTPAPVDLTPQQSAEEAHAHLRPREKPKSNAVLYGTAVVFGLLGVACWALSVNAMRLGAPTSEIGVMIGFGVSWFALAWLFVSLPRIEERRRRQRDR